MSSHNLHVKDMAECVAACEQGIIYLFIIYLFFGWARAPLKRKKKGNPAFTNRKNRSKFILV